MAAPLGNKNASHDKPWAAAVRRAVLRSVDTQDKAKKLDKLAEKLISEGLEGNTVALKEIGDRLDGKPHQSIGATVDATVTVQVVKFADSPDTR